MHAYIQTDRQTYRQTHTHTHIHTYTHTHIHTYTQTYIHTYIYIYINSARLPLYLMPLCTNNVKSIIVVCRVTCVEFGGFMGSASSRIVLGGFT